MLRITIELFPGGRESERRDIAQADIARVSDGPLADYRVTLEDAVLGEVGECAVVRGYPQRAASVWDLVARGISAALNQDIESLPGRPPKPQVTVHEVLQELRPFDRFVHDLAAFLINVVHLEHLLGDIDAHGHTVHRGSSGCREMRAFSTWAHRCRWPVRVHPVLCSYGLGWDAFISFSIHFRALRQRVARNRVDLILSHRGSPAVVLDLQGGGFGAPNPKSWRSPIYARGSSRGTSGMRKAISQNPESH